MSLRIKSLRLSKSSDPVWKQQSSNGARNTKASNEKEIPWDLNFQNIHNESLISPDIRLVVDLLLGQSSTKMKDESLT